MVGRNATERCEPRKEPLKCVTSSSSSPLSPPCRDDPKRFVAFDSIATNLHPDDSDDTQDVFRRDVLGTAEQQAARISINDVSLAEGDSGQTAFRFTVSLDQAQSAPVTVDFATAAGIGTATAPSDYTAASGTVTFAPGETTKTITVQVNGDTTVEPDETFTVNLANATGNATIADIQAAGTILNDDQVVIEQPSRISIADLSLAEGDSGQTPFGFTVSLDQAQSAPVTVDFATAAGIGTHCTERLHRRQRDGHLRARRDHQDDHRPGQRRHHRRARPSPSTSRTPPVTQRSPTRKPSERSSTTTRP
jgi:Calx-beta domain